MSIKPLPSSVSKFTGALIEIDEGDDSPAGQIELPPSQPSQPGKPKGWQATFADKARDVLSSEVAVVRANVSVGSPLAGARFHGSLTEKIALKNDDPLVTSNIDRMAAAKNGQTWTKVKVVGDAGFTLLGVGADRGGKVSAIVPTNSKVSGKSLAHLPIDQAKLLTLEFHPDGITKFKPGSEFLIEGHKTNSFGAVIGASVAVFAAQAGAEVGGEILWDRSAYAKSVAVLSDNEVGVRIDKRTRLGASMGTGFGAGYGVVDNDRRQKVGDFRQEANHANVTSFHIGPSNSRTKSIAVSGKFNMVSKNGRAAYSYMMDADPHKLGTDAKAARAALEKFGMKVAYAEKTIESGADLSASVGKKDLINLGHTNRSSRGVLYEVVSEDGKLIDESRLTEKEYTRSATGLLPRWFNGEEREVAIRMGAISVNGGPEERAALMQLRVMDPEVTDGESKQYVNFAAQMGFKTEQKPNGSKGKGELLIKLGMTHDMITKLDSLSKDEFAASVGQSLEGINGHPLPWNDETICKQSTAYWNEQFKAPVSVKARWAEVINDLANQETNGLSDMKIKQQYESATGRNYYADMNTWRSIQLISNEFEKAKGKPLEKRASFLKTLSRLSAPELRATLLTMRSKAGAGIVALDYAGNGVTIHAQPEVKAPKTIRQIADEALAEGRR